MSESRAWGSIGRVVVQAPEGQVWQTQEHSLGQSINEVLMHPDAVVVDVAAGAYSPVLVIIGPFPGQDAVKRTFLVSDFSHMVTGEQAYLGRVVIPSTYEPPPGTPPITPSPAYVFERKA